MGCETTATHRLLTIFDRAKKSDFWHLLRHSENSVLRIPVRAVITQLHWRQSMTLTVIKSRICRLAPLVAETVVVCVSYSLQAGNDLSAFSVWFTDLAVLMK